MLGLAIAGAVTAWVGYMLLKKYKPQGVLLIAGMVLMAAAVAIGAGPLLPAKQSTGLMWFDIFETVKRTFSTRIAGLGLTIMTIAGFVKYMEYCGANRALAELSTRPLQWVRSPLIIMMLAYFISQILTLFVPSHAGIAMLLMLTMYPILRKAGLTKLTALAIVATAKFTDYGPISSNSILAATTAGLDPVTYFIHYQLPVGIPTIIAVGITHYIVQPWWDRKEAAELAAVGAVAEEKKEEEKPAPPAIYALLPTLPLALVIAFSPFFTKSIKLDIIDAMLICTVVSLIFELIRVRSVKTVLDSLSNFFEGMGKQFIIVVSLILCGETFGTGLVKIGAVDTLIAGAQSAGFGLGAMVIAISVIMITCAFLMGSGNAAFFSFAGLAPKIAEYLKVEPVLILLPMELTAGFGRCLSPITAAIVAIAGIAGVSPMQIAKRCAIPVSVAIVVNMIATFVIFL